MKRSIVAASILALGPMSAVAADLPVKARPAAVAVFSWTGGYVGLNAGGVYGATDVSTLLPVDNIGTGAAANAQLAGTGSTNGTSFIGGAQIGYNWQLPAKLVLGVEADIQGMDLNQNRTSPVFTSPGRTQDFDQVQHTWLATFRGRVGYAWDRTFFFATGGLAVGDTRFSRTQTWSFNDGCPLDPRNGLQACHVGSARTTVVGATAGVGAEWAFAGNWSVKLEYLRVWLPEQPSLRTLNNGTVLVGAQAIVHNTGDSHLDIVRVGVNYRFGPPVVAKY